jgi:lysophospholipase L1-like esterase
MERAPPPALGRPVARARYERYIAFGDSSAEGLDDPDGRGGYRGWADRLADRLAAAQGSVLYANLAVRGRRTRQVLEEQLPAVLELRPELAALVTGTNDFVRRRFDLEAVCADVERLQRELVAAGATVVTFTLPDLSPVMPLARRLGPRVAAFDEALRRISADTGVILVDLAAHPVASDPRLWSADRLHANARGHERIAAALAAALGLPGTDDAWAAPLAAAPRPSRGRRLAAEAAWLRRHLLPWVWRHLWGRSSGDGRAPKRPRLEAVEARAGPPVEEGGYPPRR